jgi:putative ABC transport system permease protein
MTRLWTGVRMSWRVWRRAPGTAGAIIVLLGLGIGGVLSLFNPLSSVAHPPLPVPDADRLVRIGGDIPLFDGYSREFAERRRLSSILTNVAAYVPVIEGAGTRLVTNGLPRDVKAEAVTTEFFATLGVAPELGRVPGAADSDALVAVVSHRLWRSEWQGAGGAVGSTIRLGVQSRLVIGVMPRGFEFPAGTDLWVPIRTALYSSPGLEFVGRLRPGLGMKQAAQELKALGYSRGDGPSGKQGNPGPVLQSLQSFLYGDRQSLLWTLWAVAALFLLLTCAGAANLLLAHGVRRRAEIVVRLALGAGRPRVVRQLLAETLLVVAAAGALAMWLSAIAGRWLAAQWPGLPGGDVFAPAKMVLAAVVGAGVTLLCGLAPALQATRMDLVAALKLHASGRAWVGVRRRVSARDLLVGAQVALALAFLTAAGVLVRSLVARANSPLGLQTQEVELLPVDLPRLPALAAARDSFFRGRHLDPQGHYGPGPLLEELRLALEPDQRAQEDRNRSFFREAQRRLSELPEVASVAVMSPAPLTPAADRALQNPWAAFASNPLGARDRPPYVLSVIGQMTPNALDVFGIQLVEGRPFLATDVDSEVAMQRTLGSCRACTASPSAVAIVTQTLARRLWPAESAIGRALYVPPFEARRVVGVVSDFSQGADRSSSVAAVYQPFTGTAGSGSFVARLDTGASRDRFDVEASRVVGELAPDLPPLRVQSLGDLAAEPLRSLRVTSILLGAFSVLGTLLAGLSVHAAAALAAAARTRETAIRMAVGARGADVRRLALWRTAQLGLLALPAGLLAGWALSRALSRFLFHIGAVDPVTSAAACLLILGVVLTAGMVPTLKIRETDVAALLRRE